MLSPVCRGGNTAVSKHANYDGAADSSNSADIEASTHNRLEPVQQTVERVVELLAQSRALHTQLEVATTIQDSFRVERHCGDKGVRRHFFSH